MLHLLNLATNALLLGAALAILPGLISIAANAYRQKSEGTVEEPKSTKLDGSHIATTEQAAAFSQNDPLAAEPKTPKATTAKATPQDQPTTQKTGEKNQKAKATQTDDSSPSLQDLLRKQWAAASPQQ